MQPFCCFSLLLPSLKGKHLKQKLLWYLTLNKTCIEQDIRFPVRVITLRAYISVLDDDGDEDTDTEEESGQTYTAVSNTPTRITLTATPVIKKRGKNRLKSTVRLT